MVAPRASATAKSAAADARRKAFMDAPECFKSLASYHRERGGKNTIQSIRGNRWSDCNFLWRWRRLSILVFARRLTSRSKQLLLTPRHSIANIDAGLCTDSPKVAVDL